jgi:ABC-type multidrug transport system fused ATPase/permease subunit
MQAADRILVLERGRIAQLGSHRELCDVAGPYRDFLRLQLPEPAPAAQEERTA